MLRQPMAMYTVIIAAEYRERPESDALPSKPLAYLHERLTALDIFPEGTTIEYVPPPKPEPPDRPLEEHDLPLPEHLPIDEIRNPERTGGEITLIFPGPASPGMYELAHKAISRATNGPEASYRWYSVVPPA
jgi:hypothetical protein